MRFHALACDYDGTIAANGLVDEATLAALERVRASGRRLLLVTGRELADLRRVFDRLDLFDRVVAENGAQLYRPDEREERSLTDPPHEGLVAYLRERGVQPLSVGRSIVATWEPNEAIVLEAIRALGLEMQVVFNKGAVMVLPPDVSKATGLMAALRELRLSPHDTVGIGDAENDHAFLALCEVSAAVSNALPAVKERADIVLARPRGAGVVELVEMLLGGEFDGLERTLPRLTVPLGYRDGEAVGPGRHSVVLLAGASGAGKSTLTMAFLETLLERGYQVCLVDPEGDYEHIERMVILGTAERAPTQDEVLTALEDPDRSVVVNLLALGLEARPPFAAALTARLRELRTLVGRPHWIALDEAHHLLPAEWRPGDADAHGGLGGMLFITVHPDRLSPAVVEAIDLLAAIGPDAPEAVAQVARVSARPMPRAVLSPPAGGGLLWQLDGPSPAGGSVVSFDLARPRGAIRRHRRKYAAGELGPDKSFWFRGQDDRLNLRAQNLGMFLQIAEGVDDETWSYHLQRGDYSTWMREAIKDDALAEDVAAVERESSADARRTRELVRQAVTARYTAPA